MIMDVDSRHKCIIDVSVFTQKLIVDSKLREISKQVNIRIDSQQKSPLKTFE